MPQKDKVLGRSSNHPDGLQQEHDYYLSPEYSTPERMSSYGHQFALAMKTGGRTFLNVGSANGILSYLLSQHSKSVVDLDIDPKTEPHIVAALPKLPFPDDSFDVVMCFQVLEHLPFSMFTECISELSRVASKSIILSLPDRTLSFFDQVKNLVYLLFHNPKKWRRFNQVYIDPEHFWEISQNGVTSRKIKDIFSCMGMDLITHYRNDLNYYHHFFLLNNE